VNIKKGPSKRKILQSLKAWRDRSQQLLVTFVVQTGDREEKEIKGFIQKMDEIGLDQIALTFNASGVDYEVRYAFHKRTGSMEIPKSKPD